MTDVSIVGPADGELALSGPIELRILEDGSTTAHRLGLAEIIIAPHTTGPPQQQYFRDLRDMAASGQPLPAGAARAGGQGRYWPGGFPLTRTCHATGRGTAA